MVRRLVIAICAAAVSLTLAYQVSGAVTTERVAQGLNRPVFVTAPRGDTERLFILEQRGVIKILKNGVVLGTPFLDIDALVPNISGNDERGLLGLAFHPDYAKNGKFYLNYTNLSSDTVIVEYTVSANPDIADAASADILMTIDQPFTNHNGGHIAFSPIDNYLYIGMGDGGSANDPQNNGQRDNTLLGKMLRLDIDCAAPPCIPADNPHVGPGDPLDEIWHKGLRNPYRFSFDRLTGDMYIGDVGQGSREEVDFQPANSIGGENWGWRVEEGTLCFSNSTPPGCGHPSLLPPIHEYTHGGSPFRCSITGGYVYRGTIPEIQGHYFFADFCSDQIWSFRYDGVTVNDFTDRTSELDPDVGFIRDVSGFGEDGLGELYIVDRDGSTGGEIYKIIPESTGIDPVEAPALPFQLSRAQPNPFNPLLSSTGLTLDLEVGGELEVGVFDTAGRRVRTLASREVGAGSYDFAWDGRDQAGQTMPSGVYFVRAQVDAREVSQRVVIVR